MDRRIPHRRCICLIETLQDGRRKTEDGITPGLVFRVTGKGFSHQKQREKMEALMDVIETQLPEIEFAEKRIWLDTADGSRELTKHNSVEPNLTE